MFHQTKNVLQVFMLPAEQPLDEITLQGILASGHSRIPVYKNGDRCDILGLILVKELVLLDTNQGLTVGQLTIRPLPQLSADTPLYDMLKLFEGGRSHMALLTKPRAGSVKLPRNRSGYILAGRVKCDYAFAAMHTPAQYAVVHVVLCWF